VKQAAVDAAAFKTAMAPGNAGDEGKSSGDGASNGAAGQGKATIKTRDTRASEVVAAPIVPTVAVKSPTPMTIDSSAVVTSPLRTIKK
jgi:hypothetical protein